jgi:hypothetical protein
MLGKLRNRSNSELMIVYCYKVLDGNSRCQSLRLISLAGVKESSTGMMHKIRACKPRASIICEISCIRVTGDMMLQSIKEDVFLFKDMMDPSHKDQ